MRECEKFDNELLLEKSFEKGTGFTFDFEGRVRRGR